MTRVGVCAALRSPLVFARRLFARLNRRALSAKALARVTSCGGRIAVSYPADGRTLPVVFGLKVLRGISWVGSGHRRVCCRLWG